jgi:hypothetical protein
MDRDRNNPMGIGSIYAAAAIIFHEELTVFFGIIIMLILFHTYLMLQYVTF